MRAKRSRAHRGMKMRLLGHEFAKYEHANMTSYVSLLSCWFDVDWWFSCVCVCVCTMIIKWHFCISKKL